MIISKQVIKILNEESGDSLFLGMSTDASKKVSSKAVQNSRTKEFKKDGNIVPTGKTELTNFVYSPLEGTCTWYEIFNNKNTAVILKFIDVDIWMFGTGGSPPHKLSRNLFDN